MVHESGSYYFSIVHLRKEFTAKNGTKVTMCSVTTTHE